MAWLSDLAGKAEDLLVNLDEKTASVLKDKNSKGRPTDVMYVEVPSWSQRQQSKGIYTRPNARKPSPMQESKSGFSPARRNAPSSPKLPQKYDQSKYIDIRKEVSRPAPKKSILKSKSFKYDMNYVPATMVSHHNMGTEDFNRTFGRIRPQMRNMDKLIAEGDHVESLEVENSMLKNEVHSMNQEVNQLLEKIKRTDLDLQDAQDKIFTLEKQYSHAREEKESALSELEVLKEQLAEQSISSPDISKLSAAYKTMESDLAKMTERNKSLQEQVREMELSRQSNTSVQGKLENELRFAHATIKDLREELDRSRDEKSRLQSDWDAYKLRVKNMLAAKDKEVHALQQGSDYSEGTKLLMEQLDSLREDRDELAAQVSQLSGDAAAAKKRAEQLEARASGAERLVAALRDALREERSARTKLENDYHTLTKDMNSMQMDLTHQISTLRVALREKECESESPRYHLSRNTSSVTLSPNSEMSALNVAEHNRNHDSISSEKVMTLTQSLIAKQAKIDMLIAEKNAMKLQVENIENKYKQQLACVRGDQRVVHVSDGDVLLKPRIENKPYNANSSLSKVSLQIGIFLRRHPMVRILIILYMAGLHLWVFVVLLTYTPEIHN